MSSPSREQRKIERLQQKIEKKESKKRNFWSDGISDREYLLIITTTVFFLFVSIGLILILFHKNIDEMYLSLLDMVSPVVMTIVASVAGIDITGKITTTVRERKNKKVNDVVDNNTIPSDNFNENYTNEQHYEEYDPYKNGI